MSEEYEIITSICTYNRTDEKGVIFYERLMDIQGGKLVSPLIIQGEPKTFSNRRYIFFQEMPENDDQLVVLEWYTTPRDGDPEKDYVIAKRTDYCPFYSWQYFDRDISPDEAIRKLTKGLKKLPSCNYFIQYKNEGDYIYGLKCDKEDLVFDEHQFTLREDVYSLESYRIPRKSIISFKDKLGHQYNLINQSDLKNQNGRYPTHSAFSLVKQEVLNRISWKKYKETEEGTRKQFQQIKNLIQSVSNSSLFDDLMSKTELGEEEIRKALQELQGNIEAYFSADDFDDSLIKAIFEQTPGINERYMTLAENQWAAENESKIAETNQKLKQAEERLKTANDTADRITSSLAGKRKELLKLEEQTKAAADAKKLYESELNERIAEAKDSFEKVIAGKLVDSWLWKSMDTPASTRQTETCQFTEGQSLEGDIQTYDNVLDLLEDLEDNLLSAGVRKDDCRNLAAFLYSVYVQNLNLMLAGPNGEAIANALSCVIDGRKAAVLSVSKDTSYSLQETLMASLSNVIVVRNGLECISDPDFIRGMEDQGKMFILVHPYAEDLLMEPSGIANYLVPLLTEPFIENVPSNSFYGGVPADTLKQISDKERLKNPYKKFTQQLAISPLAVNNAARLVRNMHIVRDQADKNEVPDIDLIYVLFPLAYMTDSLSFIPDVINNYEENNLTLSSEIKQYVINKLMKNGVDLP